MSAVPLLPTKGLSDVKAHLSEVMTDVVHHGRPLVVDRHSGREQMLLLGWSDAEALLGRFRFETKTMFEDGEWTLFSPELNLVAGGQEFDEALDELVELAEAYAVDYLDRKDFYRHTERVEHEPWLMRLACTPPDQRRDLFTEPPQQADILTA